jgi:hypothetical protein
VGLKTALVSGKYGTGVPDPYKIVTDTDPGGPKIYGSGTLFSTVFIIRPMVKPRAPLVLLSIPSRENIEITHDPLLLSVAQGIF